MEFWLSLQRQRLERERVKSVAEKRVSFDDEDVVCIGGGELSAMMRDEKAFPDTVSQIRRHG
jgi:Asp/Glu/hydantoin racemase